MARHANVKANSLVSKVETLNGVAKNMALAMKDLKTAERLNTKAEQLETKINNMKENAEMMAAKQMGQEKDSTTFIGDQAKIFVNELNPQMRDEINARCQRLAAMFPMQAFVLEIYAGCCRFSGAAIEAGFNIFCTH